MKKVWPWIFGIVIFLLIIGLLAFVRADREAYRTARGAIEQRVELTQDRIDATTEAALAAVDKALELAGDLPSQQPRADLVKQDIEEISDRLKEAAELRGEAAIEKLDQSVEQFNQTLQTVEEAAEEATDPVAIALLYRIYGILEAGQTQMKSKSERPAGGASGPGAAGLTAHAGASAAPGAAGSPSRAVAIVAMTAPRMAPHLVATTWRACVPGQQSSLAVPVFWNAAPSRAAMSLL